MELASLVGVENLAPSVGGTDCETREKREIRGRTSYARHQCVRAQKGVYQVEHLVHAALFVGGCWILLVACKTVIP